MNLNITDESIINILGIQTLPDERKIEIVKQATDLVQQRLLIRVMRSLEDSKRVEFESLMQAPDQAKLEAFLAANVPDFNAWMAEEVSRIKQELANLAGKIE